MGHGIIKIDVYESDSDIYFNLHPPPPPSDLALTAVKYFFYKPVRVRSL